MQGVEQEKRHVKRLLRNPRAKQTERAPARPLRNRQYKGMLRIALLLLCGGLALLTAVLALRPSVQYMNASEILRVQRIGALRVGVLSDMQGFSQDEEGLEVDLARALCQRIFPDLDPDAVLELVFVNENTAMPKLANDSVDILLAMQLSADSEAYTSSIPYFTEAIRLLCLPGRENDALISGQLVGLIDASATKTGLEAYCLAQELDLQFRYYASYEDMCIALRNGSVHYIALPASHIQRIQSAGLAVHATQTGSAAYVAISRLGEPAFALMMGLIVQEMERDGTLNALIARHGIGQYQFIAAADTR